MQVTDSPTVRRKWGFQLRTVVGLAIVVVASSTVMPFHIDAFASPAHTASDTANGLSIRGLNGDPYGVHTAIRVLTFNGSQYSLAIDLANHEIDGGLETPSSMCRSTVRCVAAVNGDYYDVTRKGQPDPGDEVGGIIQNCVLLHTPEIAHQQANLDGQQVGEGFDWSVSFDVNGVTVPISAVNQELPMKYPSVNLPLAGILLFTAPYDLRTPSAAGRLTFEFIQVNNTTSPTTSTTTSPTTSTTTSSTTSTTMSPTTSTTMSPTTSTTTIPVIGPTPSPTTINTSIELELVAQTTNAVRVMAGHVDISAPTGSSFASLQVGDTVTMTTTSTAGCNNIGGHPILLNDGAVVPISAADTYMSQKYARTVIGWTASGETVIMIVAGTDDKSGATGHQLVALLRTLHVVTALDLDGGDSTALYANRRIYYHAGRGERPVSTGLLVVQNP
jgi:exopolysaccharide biosynthesis protein